MALTDAQRLLIARHNVQLGPNITVRGTGGPAVNVTRQSFSAFDWTLQGTFPVTVTVFSIFGDQCVRVVASASHQSANVHIGRVTFTLPSLTLDWSVVDTGGQFPDPPANFNYAQSGCAQCSSPALNNGQSVIFDDGPTFPDQTGEVGVSVSVVFSVHRLLPAFQWVRLTSAAWMSCVARCVSRVALHPIWLSIARSL